MKFITLLITLLFMNIASANKNLVSVLKATSSIGYVYHGIGWQNISVVVKANNNIEKVTLINQGKELEAIKIKEIDNNFSIWEYAKRIQVYGGNSGKYLDFQVRGTNENGETFIDDNDGNNYELFTGDGTYLSKNINVSARQSYVIKDHYLSSSHGFNGKIDIKNIAYEKEVKIHYTLDNWKTVKVLNATYQHGFHNVMYDINSPNRFGVEVWGFYIDSKNYKHLKSPTIKYAISYKVMGKTYWDNNFGANYEINFN